MDGWCERRREGFEIDDDVCVASSRVVVSRPIL